MRYLAARNVTDGSEVVPMQTFRHLEATWGSPPGRVETVGPAPQRLTRNSVMASPLHHRSTAVTLSSVGAWVSIAGQAHRERRILLVPKAAIYQAVGIPAWAADRAPSGYCHG
jgi:hypothetical protein